MGKGVMVRGVGEEKRNSKMEGPAEQGNQSPPNHSCFGDSSKALSPATGWARSQVKCSCWGQGGVPGIWVESPAISFCEGEPAGWSACGISGNWSNSLVWEGTILPPTHTTCEEMTKFHASMFVPSWKVPSRALIPGVKNSFFLWINNCMMERILMKSFRFFDVFESLKVAPARGIGSPLPFTGALKTEDDADWAHFFRSTFQT